MTTPKKNTQSTPPKNSRSGTGKIAFLTVSGLTIGLLAFVFFPSKKKAPIDAPPAIQSIYDWSGKIGSFDVIELPKQGTVEVKPSKGITITHLQGHDLDDNPPIMKKADIHYEDARMSDEYPPGEAPYVAQDIKPFRLNHFHTEFNYAGHHTFKMADYASTHGFDTIAPYVRKKEEIAPVLPENTHTVLSFGFNPKFFDLLGISHHRYDQIIWNESTLTHLFNSFNHAKRTPDDLPAKPKYLMLDMEEPVLKPEQLRQQDWYPLEQSQQTAFEKRYYDNYALLHTRSVELFHSLGYENISIYGWYPYGRTWGGLEKLEAEPGIDTAWNLFGKKIHAAVDIINNSVYCFYWSPQNVAYVLKNIDLNKSILNDVGSKKRVIPYFWDLLHGGGGGWRWWEGQPLPNEEQRAIIAMSFFTGIDGISLWNWSDTNNPHRISDLYELAKKENALQNKPFAHALDYMVKDSFSATELEKQTSINFQRYDVIHITRQSKNEGKVVFQKVQLETTEDRGINPSFPYYEADAKDLASHLRTKSDGISATIEGLALVKAFELFLKQGEVKIDLDMKEAFQKSLPLVRRKKLDNHHLVITYNPKFVHGSPEVAQITLNDFDGNKGLTLVLPADDQVRIFALRDITLQ